MLMQTSAGRDAATLSLDAPASLICRYCSEGTGRPGAERERFVAHGTLGSLTDHLFALEDDTFEAHFIATDVADLHRDDLIALRADPVLA